MNVRGLGWRVVLQPTPQSWDVPAMSQSISVVGLDVHASQTAIAVVDPLTGELRRARIRGATAEVLAFLQTLGPHRAV
jgi:hypothetical protein